MRDAEIYEKMAELAQYAESLQSIKLAMSEPGRALEEFTTEFEAEREIRRTTKVRDGTRSPLAISAA